MIKWDDKYSTGLTSLDEQHKMLFKYLNDLEGTVEEKDVSDTLLSGALDFFENYIKSHFGNEEACMYRYNCPIAQTNKDAHGQFVEFYNNYKICFEKEGPSYALYRDMLDFYEKWLIEHICKIDVQIKSCILK